jgi:hypothetical protein
LPSFGSFCGCSPTLSAVAVLALRSRRSLEAENLVLRRQLGLFKERGVKARVIDAATGVSLVWSAKTYEPGGRGFKSCRARQISRVYSGHIGNVLYRR